jgi:peptidoglycan/LPS O-acetylase OafA/YrhL
VLVTHLTAVLPVGPFDARFSRSGFLGVDLFFVLSGFLITSQLLQEHTRVGVIRFGRFYARRALRLLPALVFLFALYLAYSHFTDWPPFGRRDFAFDSMEATFLYYMNWRVLWNPLGAADLTAIWSLSIEEQYYLVWPLLLLGLVSVARAPTRAAWVLGGLALAVGLWRAEVFRRWGWEAAYLRTDARVDGLLWGSMAAVLFARRRLPRLPHWTPFAVVAVWATALFVVKADRGTAHFGGITIWVIASCIMIVFLADRPEAGTRGRWAVASQRVGRVSYGLYLWQLPAFRAVERWGETWPQLVRAALGLVLLAALTLVSWFAVERPMLAVKERLSARWRAQDARAATPALTG